MWKAYKEALHENFHLVWEKVEHAWPESLRNNKVIWHSERRRDFTDDVKISRFNQLETVGDNVFSDTPPQWLMKWIDFAEWLTDEGR